MQSIQKNKLFPRRRRVDQISEAAPIIRDATPKKSMVQLPPCLLQTLDARQLRGAQFFHEEAHAQLFQ